MFLFTKPSTMVTADEALPGRDEPMRVPAAHEVLGNPIAPPFPEGLEQAVLGLGCFWGAERIFWEAPGVYTTAVGYDGGFTPNPTYEETCSGRTGHTENRPSRAIRAGTNTSETSIATATVTASAGASSRKNPSDEARSASRLSDRITAPVNTIGITASAAARTPSPDPAPDRS